jgi:hypothetical protein
MGRRGKFMSQSMGSQNRFSVVVRPDLPRRHGSSRGNGMSSVSTRELNTSLSSPGLRSQVRNKSLSCEPRSHSTAKAGCGPARAQDLVVVFISDAACQAAGKSSGGPRCARKAQRFVNTVAPTVGLAIKELPASRISSPRKIRKSCLLDNTNRLRFL